MKNNNPLSNRFTKWKFFSVLAGLLLVRAALATDSLYQNFGVLNYFIPGNPPPQIDALAFDNESGNDNQIGFSVNWGVYAVNPAFFETWNTLNYTNNGSMAVNAPIISSSSSGFVVVGETFAPGFKFDLQTTSLSTPHAMAGTFYNPGTVRCNSFLDENNVFNFGGILGFSLGTFGECVVSATNIMNPGIIQCGVNSLIQLAGQHVDLTRGTLNIENLQNFFLGSAPAVSSFAIGWGTDTNKDWDPSLDLGVSFAVSSLPYIFDLTNSTSYTRVNLVGTNLVVIRSVFVQNTSPNTPYNVYIDPNVDTGSLGFGSGAAHVEWINTYIDPGTCSPTTSFLYLTDDYVAGADTTNLFVNNGTPDNFTFLTSPTPLLTGPLSPSFVSYPAGVITNRYSYFDGNLVSTTTPTNVTPLNPSGALTNLPGRVQITASKDLNMGLVAISGQNYLSLTSTNQFDGTGGAQIYAPYSDFNLGVTNGFLAVTNLLASTIPNWNGAVGAWSTRFLTTVTNTVITATSTNSFVVTNDYRVLIVRSSQLISQTAPQVQDLKLHATNSLIISDVLNVMRTLYIDSQNLTLTTNGCGNGATSLEGELNFENNSILWQNALPNVRNLTNNGAIRTGNLVQFGGPAPANYFSFVNHGLISDQGSIIYADYFEHSGPFTNGSGGFQLQSLNAVLTNGTLVAGGDISITATNLVMGSLMLQAGRSLTLTATNLLTDNDVTNGNIWTVGGATGNNYFSLPVLPLTGELLGTTITLIARTNTVDPNIWSATNLGAVVNAYTNNAAVGHLILDSFGAYTPLNRIGIFNFTGTGVSNAMYVDFLELRDAATNRDANGNFSALNIAANMVIYFARADMNGVSIVDKINHKNNDRLRWVTNYAGFFSSTNIIFPDGSSNVFNIALAESTTIDSDGDGIANAFDPTPFGTNNPAELVPASVLMNLTLTMTNKPVLAAVLKWQTVTNATNFIVFYKTNITMPYWLPLLTNAASPTSPPVTMMLSDPIVGPARSYRVRANLKP